MKRWQYNLIIIGIILVVILFSYTLCNMRIMGFNKIIDEFSSQVFGILVGVIIAAFGVLMGTVTGLFTLFTETLQHSSKEFVEKSTDIVTRLDKVIKELKQDTLFLVFSLASCSVIPVVRKINFSYIKLLFKFLNFNKDIFLSTIAVTLILLSFYAIVDSIASMFQIYTAYSSIIKKRIQQILEEKTKGNKVKS